MGIKVKIDIKKSAINYNSYPVMARNNISGNVYLFTGPTEGVCIAGDHVGRYSNQLARLTDENWEILPHGSAITLIQETK